MINQRRIDQFSTRERQYQQSNSFYWNETDAPWAPEGYQLLSQATDMWPQSDGTLVPILTGVAFTNR